MKEHKHKWVPIPGLEKFPQRFCRCGYIKAGTKTVLVGDRIRFDSTSAAAAAGEIGVNATSGMPDAFIRSRAMPLMSNGQDSIFLQDDFVSGAIATGQIGSLGWGFTAVGGTVGWIVGEASRPGILQIATGATSGNRLSLFLSNEAVTHLGSETFDQLYICRLNTGNANTIVRIGAMDGAQTPAHGAYFEKLAADTTWFRVTRAANVQTRTDTAIATSGSFVRFRIRRISGSSIGFTIDGNAEQTNTTNLPTAGIDPVFEIETSAAANKTLDVDYCDLLITGLSR